MIPSSSRSPAPRGRVWLLGALVVTAALVLGAWLWLGEEPARVVPGPLAPVQAAVAAQDIEPALHESAASESAAPDEVDVPAGAGRTHAAPDPLATPAKPWTDGVIRGRVLGGPGAVEPVQSIVVRATSPRSSVPIPERRATTDAQGRFELRGLVAADWHLQASLPTVDRTGTVDVRVDEEQPSAEADVLIPFARELMVVLVDPRGEPVRASTLGLDPALMPLLCVGLGSTCHEPGSTLSPGDAPSHRCLDRSAKDERNTWNIVIQSSGGECVHALYGDRVIARRALLPLDQRVEIVVDAAQLSQVLGTCMLRVVSAADGAPIVHGKVRFRVSAGIAVDRTLDEDGRAFVAGCPLGSFDVRVESPGFATRAFQVSLPADALTRVEMVKARQLGGRVVLEGGRDPRRFVPEIWRVTDPTAALTTSRERASRHDETGHFAFQDLEPGIYVVSAVPWSVSGERFTANDVRAGRAAGAAWVDLTSSDAPDVLLQVPTWLGSNR